MKDLKEMLLLEIFYGKYQKLILKYKEYISLANSKEFYNNLEQIFLKIRNETLFFVKIILKLIKKQNILYLI